MRQVVLNDIIYDVEGNIQRSRIDPVIPKVGAEGSVQYTDFSRGTPKEWHDFRGGLGMQADTGATGKFWWSEGIDTSNERVITLGPQVFTAGSLSKVCRKITDFDGSGSWKTYAIADDLIAVWNTGTSSWDSEQDSNDSPAALSTPLDAIVATDSTDSYLIATSSSDAMYTTGDGSWSDWPQADLKGYMCMFDHRLVAFYNNVVYYSDRDNVDSALSSFNIAANVGTPYALFDGKLVTTGEPCIYLVSNLGLWSIDFYARTIYRMEVSWPPYDYAGHCGMYFNSYVYAASGAGIRKVTSSMTTDIGPDQDDGLPEGYQGGVWDMDTCNDWILFCVNGGSSDKSSVFKRHAALGGIHQIYSTSAVNNPIRCINYSSSSMYTNGRLWWGEGTDVKYCMLSDLTNNVTELTGYKFASSGHIELSASRPVAAMDKAALRVRALTSNCSTEDSDDIDIQVKHDIDNSGSYTSLGTIETSPTESLIFGGGTGTAFRTIQFRLDFASNDRDVTPELESLLFIWRAHSTPLYSWDFDIPCTDNEAESIIDNIESAETSTILLTFYPTGDTDDTVHYVELLNSPLTYQHEAHQYRGRIHVKVGEVFQG